MVAPRRRLGRGLSRHVARAAGARRTTQPGDIAALIARLRSGAAGADGEDLRRFRARHRARHDALAASALLRLFPGQCRAGFGRGGISVVSVMAAQCMLWQTSPAATELETKVIDWLRQALGLPEGFSGVIQDSASSATLVGRTDHARARARMVRQPHAAWPASRACGSIPPTRSTPRSTAPSGCRASARRTSCGFPTGGSWRSMDAGGAGSGDRSRSCRGLSPSRHRSPASAAPASAARMISRRLAPSRASTGSICMSTPPGRGRR